MNNIIDKTAFVNEFNIPGADKPGVSDLLDGLIKDNQSNFLRDLLGIDMYWLLKAAVESSEEPTDPIVPLPLHWSSLLNGVETQEYNFRGIKFIYTAFIYDLFQSLTVTQTASTGGEVSVKHENATISAPIEKQVRAWNAMVREIRKMHVLLNDAVYPGYYSTRRYLLDKKNTFNL